MRYRFGPFVLDVGRFELRRADRAVAVEPQVLALIAYLVENRTRLVSRDELLEKIWDNRVVSDEAVSSRIKVARHVLGDDGESQAFVQTVRRKGFRFVAEVTVDEPAAAAPARGVAPGAGVGATQTPSAAVVKPSIAVLPFTWIGEAGDYAPLSQGIAQELITELSHLHWLFVIARGSSFRMSTAETGIDEIGRILGARYCVSGTLELAGGRLAVSTEVVDSRDAVLVWAERIEGPMAELHEMRDGIRARLLSALEVRISLHEAARIRQSGLESLDAWSVYHLGLQHMYRFNRADNRLADSLFERAIALNPGFARAYAGRSFLHFQRAFLHQTDDFSGEVALARRAAERGLELDPLDPFVNFTMGRTYWLEGDLDSSRVWLERATATNPNYAEGIYARAWTEVLSGETFDGRSHVDLAMKLSPLDPLYYAMLAVRGFTHLAQGDCAGAVEWTERAARSPGAHVFIAMIAMIANAAKGDRATAQWWAGQVRERNSALSASQFLRSFPMRAGALRNQTVKALAELGF